MKIIALIALSLLIILLPKLSFIKCDIDTASLAIPPRIWSQQALDSRMQPTIITRFLHNKPGIFFSELSRCYFNFFDPSLIFHSVGLRGVFFWIFFMTNISFSKKWPIILIVLMVPILSFFKLLQFPLQFFNKIYAFLGLWLFLFKR